MDLHASADWWGLWWLVLLATLLFAATRVPLGRTKRTPQTDVVRSQERAR